MEGFIEEISTYMDSEPTDVMNRIRDLPKLEDLTDLQARMDYLLKENVELRARADEGEALRAENAGLKARADKGDVLRAENKELKDRIKVSCTSPSGVPATPWAQGGPRSDARDFWHHW